MKLRGTASRSTGSPSNGRCPTRSPSDAEIPPASRAGARVSAILLLLVSPTLGDSVVFFGGDTSHGENYQKQYAEAGKENVLRTRGYDDAFKGLRTLTDGADLVVLNLETPLTTREESPLVGKDYYHWSDPAKAIPSLKGIGVDAVSLANNHTLDYGPDGLRDTLRALGSRGVAAFGAGRDGSEAGKPFLARFGEGEDAVSIAILGAFERRGSYEKYDFYAGDETPGTNPLDVDLLSGQIAETRRRVPDAFVVVTPHWGRNYVWRSNHQREIAEQLVAAGADMIVGHGAHRLQEVERIGDAWVFYSIGNFVFNSAGRFEKLDSPPFSLPIRVHLKREGTGYRVGVRGYPIVSDNRATDFRPRLVNDKEASEVRRLLLARDSDGVLEELAVWSRDPIGHCVIVGEDGSPGGT